MGNEWRFFALITNVPPLCVPALDVEHHHRLRGGPPEEAAASSSTTLR
ncbi:MAG TPA: hypothetical protein VGL60_06890 [Acidimicrobiales bacterium]